MSGLAFHELDGSTYVPTEVSTSAWKPTDISGPAVVAAIARSLEVETAAEGMRPARLTVDLFRPVEKAPFEVRTTLVRDGNRIRVSDAELWQGDLVRSRASLVQLREAEPPAGRAWLSDSERPVPPRFVGETMGAEEFPWYFTPGAGWSNDMVAHQSAERKAYWHRPIGAVAGEEATPFQRVATFSEATSLLTNWGDAGIGYINADLTLTIARLPRSEDMGLQADVHVESDGIAIGATAVYDREGVLGTGSVVAVSNAKRHIDWNERGRIGEGFSVDGRNA